ncbi:uncharacterized protein FIBRA_06802 [Fibroporia radiculosa]|uniref:Scamp-domain-containing protein n=1 Tax=Fibroporia radiculosa TaxID=599839 RepID=J4GCJ3_9APHY|nr:uncharacterized protein FIBRA_06802 [Fibroporia radiculosa]CCM04618.1 predicted protein [Fibroporia radiculosa]
MRERDTLTENPFASTHSLDANPFEDPVSRHGTPKSSYPSPAHAARLEELNQRERDLERREQELSQKAEHIRRFGRNNWPPFYPLIFHSIQDEIPEGSRQMITRIYQLWLVLLGTLVINVVANILVLTAGSSHGASDVGSSIGYLIVIPPISFLAWYRPLYNGYMKASGEQSLYYYLYFVFGGFHLAYSLYMIVGIPSTGSAGFIQTIEQYIDGHIVAGVFGTIATVGWVLQGGGNAMYYRQIWYHHKAAGHSVAKAKSELATHGAKAYFTRG